MPKKLRPKDGGSKKIICRIHQISKHGKQFQLQSIVGIINRYFTVDLLDKIEDSAVSHLKFSSKKIYSFPKALKLLAVEKIKARSNVNSDISLLSTIHVNN